MTEVTLTTSSNDPTYGHFDLAISGDVSKSLHMHKEDILEPVTDDDIEACFKVLIKLAKQGRTLSQLKNVLEAGVTLNI